MDARQFASLLKGIAKIIVNDVKDLDWIDQFALDLAVSTNELDGTFYFLSQVCIFFFLIVFFKRV
jgi:hypothetical protein